MMNIAGLTAVDDPSYRYKMPRLLAKVEGRGNGIKTVLVNVVDIGTSLNREAAEITKFFGCELGSQTTYATDTDRAVVNGAHTAADLQTCLSRYIENFVLCKQCHLPEAHYKVKGGIISQKCLACGHKDTVDMTHKLTTFILSQNKKAKESKDAKDKKKEKKEKKAAEEESSEGGPAPAAGGGGGEVVKEKKSKKDKKDKSGDDIVLDKKVSRKKTPDLDGDEPASNELEDETDRSATEDGINRFRLWSLDNPEAPLTNVLEELRMIQTFASLRVHDRVIVYIGALFTEAVVTAGEISAHKEVLAALGSTQILQRHLIAGFEWFCGTRFPALAKLFPVILKQLFDEELVEEDVFYAWSTDFTRNEHTADISMITMDVLEQLKANALPFVTWLQQAEEEGEDGEEDLEDDDEEEEEEDA